MRGFTKGPWAVCTDPKNDHWYKGRTIYKVWESDWCGGERVADVTHFMADDEAFANAHLIAAAPDLYRACEVALGWSTGGMDGDWADVDLNDLLRTALAKARGEQ